MYVGFYPCNDPGLRKALAGRKRTRKKVSVTVEEQAMIWRLSHPNAESLWGRYLVAQPDDDLMPDRVLAYGRTQGATLMVYYRVYWTP